MMYFAGQAETEDSSVLHAAVGLADQIRAASDKIETGRRIPRSIATVTKESGVFGRRCPRLGRSGNGPADTDSGYRGPCHGRWLGRLVRDDRL